ncbi:MAG: hypothetical protein K6T73_11360 [Candidatus Bathyarchaeota archaeon]|nr:hypothetical protein [Candidatus Bathyarchaeota archaeon]
MRVKIFYDHPLQVEEKLNQWIHDKKPSVLFAEAKKLKVPHVVHCHCVGLGDKLCVVVFYESPEELFEAVE